MVHNVDASGNDIENAGTNNVANLQAMCAALDFCAGFNTNGWLKYDVSTQVPNVGSDLYMKDPPPKARDPCPLNVWPVPDQYTVGNTTLSVTRSANFFAATGSQSPILTQALTRYISYLFPINSDDNVKSSDRVEAALVGCDVNVLKTDDTLQLGVDETYQITVPQTGGRATISANTVYGALRGLETFVQIVEFDYSGQYTVMAPISIKDAPRYAHRSLLIDTSRHYLPIPTIKSSIDALAANKMNTLHWHIVDDNSFPYQSTTFPLLSEKGAFDPKRAIYTQQDVQDIIQYGKFRGIRVMVEFDMPAHTSSWFPGYPQLRGSGECGFDPTLDSTYDFVDKFFAEISKVFPEKYVHLGGDELSFGCWNSEAINTWMKNHGIATKNDLESYFEAKVLALAAKYNMSVMVWQDVFNNGVKLAPQTVVEVWRGKDWATLKAVVAAGYPAVMSGFWYLDNLGAYWSDFYGDDIDQAGLTPAQEQLVVGGEACMWGEWVDENNFDQRVWPRASAVAEVLWSPKDYPKIPNYNFSARRLHKLKCRLNLRGIHVQPVGIGYGVSLCDPL